jgi:hypothetical protein
MRSPQVPRNYSINARAIERSTPRIVKVVLDSGSPIGVLGETNRSSLLSHTIIIQGGFPYENFQLGFSPPISLKVKGITS